MKFAEPVKAKMRSFRHTPKSWDTLCQVITDQNVSDDAKANLMITYVITRVVVALVVLFSFIPIYYGAKMLDDSPGRTERACYTHGGFYQETRGVSDYLTCSGTRH